MLERIFAIFGAMWITGRLEEHRAKKKDNANCGCGCLCFIGLWFLGVLLLKACS